MRNLTITLTTALATLALAACGAGGDDSAKPASAPRDKALDGALKFARCMRAAGVDVPDPKPGDGGLVVRAGDPNAPNPESPRFKTADKECHSHLAAADKSVRGEGSA